MSTEQELVDRLRKPMHCEDRMKAWDTLRAAIARGDRGSWPRDAIETWLDEADQSRWEASATIERLVRERDDAKARIVELEAGLRPFREVAGLFEHMDDDGGSVLVNVRLGSLRTALEEEKRIQSKERDG